MLLLLLLLLRVCVDFLFLNMKDRMERCRVLQELETLETQARKVIDCLLSVPEGWRIHIAIGGARLMHLFRGDLSVVQAGRGQRKVRY